MANLSNRLNLINDAVMVRSAKRLYNAIRKYAPYKKIKDAVYISRVEGRGDSRFITVGINMNKSTGGAPFARAFDVGSGIHATKGKRGKYHIPTIALPAGKFLQFEGTNEFSGRIIRTRDVQHPGVEGVGYTKKAIAESRKPIRDEISKEVVKNLRLYLKAEFSNLGKK